ncbi:hypothetical protein J4G78_14960 [Parasphingorhabdus cellanae]|uniref:Uncharacterized protein n=1 Tax=Parasphingorhabdus cellanae TaxID=2806553 RepID=A0ABX7T1P7_9SPHN|nr:hypothetical protein J4G78_14960 [Parasphingorhabdus cellanae]
MIGLTELIIIAVIVIFALLWWLWPKNDRPDLTAPPKDLQPRQNILGDQHQISGEKGPAAAHDPLAGTIRHDRTEQPDTDPLMQQA